MSSNLTSRVTSQIRAEMGRQDCRRAELARRLSVPEPWIGRRLNGVTPITLPDLERIAGALGVPAESLLTAATLAA